MSRGNVPFTSNLILECLLGKVLLGICGVISQFELQKWKDATNQLNLYGVSFFFLATKLNVTLRFGFKGPLVMAHYGC